MAARKFRAPQLREMKMTFLIDVFASRCCSASFGSQTEQFSHPHRRLQLRGYYCKLRAKIDFDLRPTSKKAGHKLAEKHEDF